MRMLLTSMVIVLFSVLTAGQALATRYTEVIVGADCNEWNADITVRLAWSLSEADMAYDVAIEDLDGNVLLNTAGVETLVDDDGDHYVTVQLGDLWNDVTDEIIPLYGVFVIRVHFTLISTPENPVTAPHYEELFTAECAVVPNDDVSWGAAKSQYR